MRKFLPALASACLLQSALADEGMWTIDNFPSAAVADRYRVDIDDAWLQTAQLTTVRLEGGCTGSFSSPDGLVLTNNHCTWSCIRDLSTPGRNLSNEGFMAATRAEELVCPGQQVSVLLGMDDVTGKVAAATARLPEAEANDARKAELTRLESACEAAAGGNLRCEAVTLYNGGQYFIYRYKRYDDVRLVFAPELDIAAFGGDPDNFNFPRWSFDMSFLRVYEDGRPARTPHYLPWRAAGPSSGEPVFVSGHPGSTDRSLTVSQLRFQRDVSIPLYLYRQIEFRGRLLAWQDTGDEAARAVQQRILGIENGIKVRRNQLKALHDDAMLAKKAAEEAELRRVVMADDGMREAWGDAWDIIDGAMAAYRNLYEDYLFIEDGAGFGGSLFGYARTIVRGTAEREKPNEERLRPYTDAALPQREQRLLASQPINKEFETLSMTFSLEKMREWLGPDSPYVHKILGNESPAALAARLVAGSSLDDPGVRRALWEGGVAAVRDSDDPMIRLALAIDADARALLKRYEDEVEAPRIRGEEMIADARFHVYGTNIYPDATFTLRVTYGTVAGWEEKGSMVEPFTHTARLFERTTGERPFMLPASWVAARESLDPDTPFNFAATTDITGGNSGSPIVAADGQLVGLAFDGNIHSIAGDYWFNPANNRTVGVNTAIMLEALDTVYGADHLLEELRVIR